jgi:ribosomal protein S12 methylthiotransferase accessory factor
VAIRTGNDKRAGARTDLVAGEGEGSTVGAAQHGKKDVPQFAPSFTVYVLPPDTVCLYSEDRKFFLHGAVYCAIAAAIGAGKNVQEIERDLVRDYPADQIREAWKRLLDRRFILPADPVSTGPAAAFWASLGILPESAEKNLQKFRVRIRAVDVTGAAELSEALSGLGVRVVKHSADLTITLVSDYLDGQLAELNRRHLAEGTSWLLVQPSGVFPLVGPVFSPGKTACWNCLADRMKWNREVKAFLDRKQARRVVDSPLARNTFGQTGIQLASLEIAKAIATEFRTDLRDHVVSLDLLGSTIVRHFVATRPQCTACGREALRDPARAPVPIELAAGGKLVMTSGGYRAVSPEATVARFRKHVSPLTGVVSSLERIEADLSLNTSYLASHNFSPRPETVGALKAGLRADSYGKGSTAQQAEASALMEAIERYSGIFQGDEIRTLRRFTDFAPGDAIAPNDVMLFSDAQYARRDDATQGHDDSPAPNPFDPSAEIEWTPVWSLRDKTFRHLPTSLLYYFRRGPGADQTSADSNGCAAGNSLEEAIVQGFLELVERDSYAIWWYNRTQHPELDLERLDDSYILDLKAQLTDAGRKLWVLDITNDLGIPSFVAISHWMEGDKECLEFGSGSHFDTRIAALRAITELNQFFSIGLLARRNAQKTGRDASPEWKLEEHPYFTPRGAPMLRPDFGTSFGHLDKREQVLACMRLAEQKGMDFLVLDQTRPDIGVPVARVIVPGLRHFYRRYAPGRLYDVPVKLGLRDRRISESDLNPLFPPT